MRDEGDRGERKKRDEGRVLRGRREQKEKRGVKTGERKGEKGEETRWREGEWGREREGRVKKKVGG